MNLTQSDLERIDRESLRILAEIGVRVDDEALAARAVAAGARPGKSAGTLRLPSDMVREHVGLAPRVAAFADGAGRVTYVGPGRPATFWTGAALNLIEGRESRPIRSGDLARIARAADALESVFAVVGTSLEDVPPPARDFVGFRIMAQHTGKHLRPLLFTPAGVQPILEMARVLADPLPLADCPLVSFGYSCLSPLHWGRTAVSLWRQSSGHRIPLMLNGEPMAGATSPVTLAGSVALANAEVLAGVVLVQLLEPGRPVVHNIGFAHAMEMRTGVCLSGAAECALMAYAGAKLAGWYGLPSASWMCTDSFCDDGQAAAEKMLTGLAHVAGGTSIVWGMGQLQSQKAFSLAQMVMDDETVRCLIRWQRGLCVDDEALAFEVIRDVVTGGADFLGHEHTLAHYRHELSECHLFARTTREAWEAQGSLGLVDRARARVAQILAGPPVSRLSEAQEQALLAVEERALERLSER